VINVARKTPLQIKLRICI